MNHLPTSCPSASLGSITSNHDGKRVPIKAADRANRRGDYRYYGAQGVIDSIDDYLFDGTYLLIAEDGANLTSRNQPIAQIVAGKFWVNNHAHVVQAVDGICLKYLMHCVNANPLDGVVRGTAQPKLTQADLNRLMIPIPPLDEQDRIVAAIEEQFSRLDAGIASIDRAGANLNRMRSSVLNVAVADAMDCVAQRMTPLGELVVSSLTNGRSVQDGPEDGFPVLRLTAVRDRWIDTTCIKKGAWTATEAAPYRIRSGDFLVVRGNGNKRFVGRGALVASDSEIAYPDTLIRVRFDQAIIHLQYAALVWGSPTVRRQIEAVARTTAGIYKINQKDLSRITVPVPPICDQLRILADASRRLDAIGTVGATLSAQLKRSASLRSAILVAFVGQPVPQPVSGKTPSDAPEAISTRYPSSVQRDQVTA